MLKICVVGCGGISGCHVPAWKRMPDVEVVGVCDIRPEMMDKYPDVPHFTDWETMLNEAKPDILDICLPTYLHPPVALSALKRGIHVVSEKPVSLKTGDAKRLYDAAKENHVFFMVAQVLRFWPEYCAVKEAVDKGTYGKLLSGTMTRLNAIPGWSWDNWMKDPDRSGLVPYDLHIHDLDFLVYTFGKPENYTSRRPNTPGQDYILAVYDYSGFSIAAEAAWYDASMPFSAGFRFQFEKALVVYDQNGFAVYHQDRTIEKPFKTGEDGGVLGLPASDAYYNELRYFADCVTTGTNPDLVKAEELECVIAILNSLGKN